MSFTAIDLALFSGTAGSGAGISASLLGTIYGASGAAGGNPIQALQIAQATQSQEITQTEQQPAVARDIATFESAVTSATSPAQLLANPTVQKVLLTASGMSDQVGFSALATQALLSNPSDPNALVNQLSDQRWLTVNQTYNFATQGLSVIQQPSVLATIASGYAEQVWYQSLNATTPGLSNALSFMQQAPTITSASQILGNSSLFNVVTTALGIPQQIVLQDSAAQQQAITSQLDLSRLTDPTYVQGITDQYLIAMQQQGGGTQTSLDSLAVQASAGLIV